MAKPPASPPPASRPAGGGSTGGGKGAERCAFCGRREIEAGRLIAGAKAAICADCIRRLGDTLKSADGRRPPRR